MSSVLERVQKEHDELDGNLEKLAYFIDCNYDFDKLTRESAGLLEMQRSAMESYLCVLAMRIVVLEEQTDE